MYFIEKGIIAGYSTFCGKVLMVIKHSKNLNVNIHEIQRICNRFCNRAWSFTLRRWAGTSVMAVSKCYLANISVSSLNIHMKTLTNFHAFSSNNSLISKFKSGGSNEKHL